MEGTRKQDSFTVRIENSHCSRFKVQGSPANSSLVCMRNCVPIRVQVLILILTNAHGNSHLSFHVNNDRSAERKSRAIRQGSNHCWISLDLDRRVD